MYKKILTYLLIASLSGLLISCAKDETTDEDPTGGTVGTTSSSGFSWSVNNGASVAANDYFFVSAFNNIVGKKTGNGSYVDITLDNLTPGTYNISPSKGIIFEYFDGSKSYSGTSGVVTISAKTGSLISGHFTAAISHSIITSVSGQFTEVPEK